MTAQGKPRDVHLMLVNVTNSHRASGHVVMRENDDQELSRSATHHLKVSQAFFRVLCRAISELSMETSALYSFRRLLIYVLAHRKTDLYQVGTPILGNLCNPDKVGGHIRLTVRIDSRHNDFLRGFREHAEAQLGRPVSVAEAIRICIYVVTGK